MKCWNQDCQEKYQSPQIGRWHHPYHRKWRRTKEPLDESERGEWKSWLKTFKKLISGIWSHHFMSAVNVHTDFGAPKIKSVTVCLVSPSFFHEVMEPDAMILVFWMLGFKPPFSLFSFTFIKKLFSSCLLSAIRVVSSAYLKLLIYLSQQPWFQFVLRPAQHFSWCTLYITWVSRVTVYSLDIFLSQFGTSPLFHVQF